MSKSTMGALVVPAIAFISRKFVGVRVIRVVYVSTVGRSAGGGELDRFTK